MTYSLKKLVLSLLYMYINVAPIEQISANQCAKENIRAIYSYKTLNSNQYVLIKYKFEPIKFKDYRLIM